MHTAGLAQDMPMVGALEKLRSWSPNYDIEAVQLPDVQDDAPLRDDIEVVANNVEWAFGPVVTLAAASRTPVSVADHRPSALSRRERQAANTLGPNAECIDLRDAGTTTSSSTSAPHLRRRPPAVSRTKSMFAMAPPPPPPLEPSAGL